MTYNRIHRQHILDRLSPEAKALLTAQHEDMADCIASLWNSNPAIARRLEKNFITLLEMEADK